MKKQKDMNNYRNSLAERRQSSDYRWNYGKVAEVKDNYVMMRLGVILTEGR